MALRGRPAAETDAANGGTVRVLIAEEHPLTRFGVRRTLEEHGFAVCGEAADVAGAVEAAIRERPDVCLVAIDLPGDALEAVRALTSKLPGVAVVLLTRTGEEPELLDALCAGALGHIPKRADPQRLPVALRGIVEGDVAVPRSVFARLIDDFRRGRKGLALGSEAGDLTTREWEVLESLREGLSTAEIARRLFISQVTVRTHICSILKKLQVPDRQAAIRRVRDVENPVNALEKFQRK